MFSRYYIIENFFNHCENIPGIQHFYCIETNFVIKVYFISVFSWSDCANISGFPWWIFFGFFANERQNFEKKIKRKIKKNEEEKQGLI